MAKNRMWDIFEAAAEEMQREQSQQNNSNTGGSTSYGYNWNPNETFRSGSIGSAADFPSRRTSVYGNNDTGTTTSYRDHTYGFNFPRGKNWKSSTVTASEQRRQDREDSNKINELTDWAKKIRTTTSGKELDKASGEVSKYAQWFLDNQKKFNDVTMNSVTRLLQTANDEINSKKREKVAERVQNTSTTSTTPNVNRTYEDMTDDELKKQRDLLNKESEQYKVGDEMAYAQSAMSRMGDMEGIARLQENDRKYKQMQASVAQIDDILKGREKQRAFDEEEAQYQPFREAADYLEKSKYQQTANPLASENALYEYVNRNPDAVRLAQDYGYTGASNTGFSIDNDKTFLEQMDDDEIRMFNYLYNTEGRESAEDYLAHIRSGLTKRQSEETIATYQAEAEKDPVASSIASVLQKPFSGFSYLGSAADLIANGEIDPNARYQQYSKIPNAIRNKVSENFGEVGSFFYNTGMSMADFLWSGVMSGGAEPLMLGIMGSGAASDKVIEAKENGLDDGDAFALGTIAGLAEVVTEKVSVDALLNNIPKLGKNLAGYIGKNMLAEGSEEVASDLINTVADVMISKDKSAWKKSIQAYMDQGYSENEAFARAMGDQAAQLGLSFAGGALSGGFMGGGAGAGSVVNNTLNRVGNYLDTANESTVNYDEEGTEGVSDTEEGRKQQKTAERIVSLMDEQDAGQEASADKTRTALDTAAQEMSEADENIRNEFVSDVEQNSSMGKSGKQGLVQMYDMNSEYADSRNMTPMQKDAYMSDVQRVWNEAYTAGKNGQNLSENLQVRLQDAPDEMRYTALEANRAGILDAKYEIASRTANATEYVRPEQTGKGMRVFNKADAGVVKSAEYHALIASGRLSKETAKRFSTLGKALGVRVNFVESMEENGKYDWKTGEITIAADAELNNTMDFYFGHEFTHRLEQAAPKQYQSLVTAIQSAMTEKEYSAAKEKYAKLGVTGDDVIHEITADYVGNLLNKDSTALDDFLRAHVGTKEGRNLIQKLRDFIRSMARKLHGNEQSKRYSEVEKVLSDALNMSYDEAQKFLNDRQSAREAKAENATVRNNKRDRYEAKERYVDKLMRENAKIETLTDEQHNALAAVASMRHDLHSNAESYFYSESSADWGIFDDINSTLENAGLPQIDFSYNIEDFPSDNDYYEDLYGDKDQYEDFNDWLENSDAYSDFYEMMGSINNDIENYLREIDKEHGTQYAPTGYARLRNSHRGTDAAYMKAVESGDMDAAQRLVDEAAEEAGYNIETFHGTNAKFDKFKKNSHFGTQIYQALDRLGFYNDILDEYEDDPDVSELLTRAEESGARVMRLYIKANSPLETDDLGDWSYDYLVRRLPEYLPDTDIDWDSLRNVNDVISALKRLGYDSIVYENLREGRDEDEGDNDAYILFDPHQAKLADPVTYDDSGNVIPLSERFDSEKPDIRYSIRSAYNSIGFDVDIDANGVLSMKFDGEEVTKVTEEHVKNSGLGAMIKLARDTGNIKPKDYNDQIKAAADLFNMIAETQDPQLVWEWTGASLFSAIKSNSDGQYGTTVDFTTICKKTQEMVTAMSQAMKDLKRGLTKDEVAALQKEVYESGGSVPCPVCYVFSRWAGVGSILDGINKWQEKYADYTDEQLKETMLKLNKENAKEKKARLLNEDLMYQQYQAEIERLSAFNKEQNKLLKKLDPEIAAMRRATIEENKAQIKRLRQACSNMVSRTSAELAWLKNVRTTTKINKDTGKIESFSTEAWDAEGPVKQDILFDLDKGAEFAKQYPAAWRYRTTRGPSAGKAILPYSEMRLGDLITGPKKGGQFGEVTDGEFNADQQKMIVSAIAKTRAQNIIGGQRFQSTSDYRSEYALDYLQVFWEAQALGSNMQTYTKVVEFADIIAAVGGDGNLSVMGQGQGFEGDKDSLVYDPETGMYSNGTLKYSSTTGMDIDAAIKASRQHDSVQLILVGINDAHVRLALNDATIEKIDPETGEKVQVSVTGGSDIGFVIPWHASGNADAFIAELVRNLGESYTESNYQDYSRVQEDHTTATATADQVRRRELRKKLLQGRESGKNWKPSEDDLQFIKGKSKDISNRSFADLLDVERRALSGKDPKALADYESWSAGILNDLYQNMWVDDSNDLYWWENPYTKEKTPVRLNSAQSGSVMPHEYWNQKVDRAHAYVNGFIFRSYCHNLGLRPRFTGYATETVTKAGKITNDGRVSFGDFSDCAGYWKTLIDRPMYDNEGNYRAQNTINVSKLHQDMLRPEYAETNWQEYYVQAPDNVRAKRVGSKFAQKLDAGTVRNSKRGSTNILESAKVSTDTAALEKQVKDLQKEVARLNSAFVPNKGYKASMPSANRLAKKLRNKYGVASNIGVDGETLADFANRIMRGDDYSTVRHDVTQLANKLILNSENLVQTKAVRDYFEGLNILVDTEMRNELDMKDIRERYSGRVSFTYETSKGKSINEVYKELQKNYRWLLPDDVNGSTDQLEAVLSAYEVVDNIATNLYSEYNADTIDLATNDIMIDLILMPSVKNPDSFMDKVNKREDMLRQQNERVKQMQRENEDKLKERLRTLRKQRDEKLEMIRQRKREARQRKYGSELRKKLLTVGKRLETMKTTGENKRVIEQLLGDLDTVSASMTGNTLYKLDYLRYWVERMQKEDPDYIVDEGTKEKLARLERVQKQIENSGRTLEDVIKEGKGWNQIEYMNENDAYDNSIEFMEDLLHVMKALETQIRNAKNTIDTEDRRDVFMQGDASMSAINNSWGINSTAAKLVDRWIFTEAARPETEMLRIVGYNEDAPLYQRFKDLTAGQRKMVDYARRANVNYFDKFLNDKAFQREVTGKHAREIEITGVGKNNNQVSVKVTPDLLMSLYMHSLNDQNSRHMQEGGVVIPNLKLYKDGKIADAYSENNGATKLTLSRTAIRNLAIDNLTQKEMDFVNSARRYYSEMSQPEINETSEKLLGYSVAQEENYYRIVSDPNWMRSSMEGMRHDGTIEGMGFLKDRVAQAKNPMQLIGMISQVTSDIRNHSKYVGLAIPIRNFDKVYNVNAMSFDDEGNVSQANARSVKNSIDQKWGAAANNYISKMLSDIQNPKSSMDNTYRPFLAKVRSNYAQAVLTLNASVAIKQAASYPTAAAELGWGPLAKAISTFPRTKGKKGDFIAQYSPLMRLRMEGYVSQETGDILSQGKKLPKALNWIQTVDIGTVRLLWLASEYKVKQDYPELKYGTEEFYKKVGELHTQVIEKTQPNYTELQRAQILRSDSEVIRMLNMFKTQPFQNFNILLEGFGNYRAKNIAYKNNPNEETLAAKKKAGQRLMWAVSSQIVSAFVFAGMQFLWDLFRGKDDKYKDKDKGEMDIPSWMKGIGLNMLSSFGGMIPTFGGMLVEFGESTADAVAAELGSEDPIFDQKYYGLDAGSSLENINNLATGATDAIVGFISLGKAIFNSSEAGSEIDSEQYLRDLLDVGSNMAQFFGIPVENVMKTVKGAFGSAVKISEGEYVGKYAELRLDGVTSYNKKKFYDNLFAAYSNDPSQYAWIYNKMINDNNFATSEMTAQQAVDEKLQEYLTKEDWKNNGITEDMQAEFKKKLNGGTGKEAVYQALNSMDGLTEDQINFIWNIKTKSKQSYASYAEDHAAGKTAAQKEEAKKERYETAGLNQDDISEALMDYDSDNSGGLTKDEYLLALDQMTLTDEQKDFLWKESYPNETRAEYRETYDKKYAAGKTAAQIAEKYEKAGIDQDEWKAAKKKADVDKNGSYKDAELHDAIASMNLSKSQQDFLWNEILGKKGTYSSYKPKK